MATPPARLSQYFFSLGLWQNPLLHEGPRKRAVELHLPRSFDHLVGSKQKLRRDGQAKCPGGLQIDHEIVLGRLLVEQITRLLAVQDAAT
jgi:hypothetical protein